MSTIKKGMLTKNREWCKHLRPFRKKLFWKGERYAQKRYAEKSLD